MAQYYVTWEETSLVYVYVEADSKEEALRLVKEEPVADGTVEWISDMDFQAEESS